MKLFSFSTFVVFAGLDNCYAASFEDIRLLYHNLTTGYNKDIRPAEDQCQATIIMASFYIVALQEINEVKGTMSILGYFNLKWNDFNLQWSPLCFGNASTITLPQERIWTPPLINGNAGEKIKLIRIKGAKVKVDYNGMVTWAPGTQFVFTCSITSVDFPFDEQICHLELITWGYNDQEIHFSSKFDHVLTLNYIENSEWELKGTTVKTQNIVNDVPQITFTLHYKRRHIYFVFNLILPTVLMSFLNVCVFLIPQDSGERVSFSVTMLLTLIVFLTIAQGLFPAVALPELPRLCVYLVGNVTISVCIVLSTITGSCFYYKNSKVPVRLQTMLSVCKCKRNVWCVCYGNDCEDVGRSENPTEDITQCVTWKHVAKCWNTLSFCFYMIICIVWSIQILEGIQRNS